jgi:hypothetical protein
MFANRQKMQRFATISFLLLVLSCCTVTLRNHTLHHEDGEYKMPLFSRTRKLDTPFSDQLAPRLTCSDMMKLVVAIEGSDEESSIADELPADHALDMYVDKTSTDTQAIIVISEVSQYAAVVFRSTEYDNLDDWKLNLSISKVSFGPVAPSNAKVHSGFWNCAIGNGLGDVFESRLKELMNDSSLKLNMVYIAGHSMVSRYPLIFTFFFDPLCSPSICCS